MTAVMNSRDPVRSEDRRNGPVVRGYAEILAYYQGLRKSDAQAIPLPPPWPGFLAAAYAVNLERPVILTNSPRHGYLHERGYSGARPVWGLEIEGELET